MPIPEDIKNKMRFYGVTERSIQKISGAWNYVSATIPGVPHPFWDVADDPDVDIGIRVEYDFEGDPLNPWMLWESHEGTLSYIVLDESDRDGTWYLDGKPGTLSRHLAESWDSTKVLPAFAHDFLTRLVKNRANDPNCT